MVNDWYTPPGGGACAEMISSLTPDAYDAALAELTARDSDLAGVIGRFGAPPIRRREPGFATLVLLILEQQVSLASANATFERLAAAVGEMTPRRLLALDDEALKSAGLSRQKTRYVRLLAEAVTGGTLPVDALSGLADDDARRRLTGITGIGAWTADIYLLAALGRPDVWPAGDLALAVAAHEVKRLAARPGIAELDALGEEWRPWRAVAARILWHYYLNTKRNKEGKARQ